MKIKEIFGNKKIFAVVITFAIIIAILLTTVLVMILSGYEKDVGEPDMLGKMLGDISDSCPSVYLCELEYTVDEVTLRGRYELTLTDPESRSAKLEYEYEKLGKAGEDNSFKVTENGTLYARNASEVGELKDGAIVWDGVAVSIDISPVKLNKESLKSSDITEKNGVRYLQAVLDKSVIGYEASCIFECDAEKGDLLKLTLEYTDIYGAKVTAVYTYSYSVDSVHSGNVM